MKRIILLIIIIILSTIAIYVRNNHLRPSSMNPATPTYQLGDIMDDLNGINIYYNGDSSVDLGRNLAPDGYNLGLKYQCVEFVKRYYYEKLNHRMPNAWGHARDFYDPSIPDGTLNPRRALLQFQNGGISKPQPEDIIIFSPSETNQYGHVAIISQVTDTQIEIAQQNSGPTGSPRATLELTHQNNTWKVSTPRIQGWLRIP
ncbi:MAG: CHAP domain-containing protein [Akkermansiaceae bacterium]